LLPQPNATEINPNAAPPPKKAKSLWNRRLEAGGTKFASLAKKNEKKFSPDFFFLQRLSTSVT
jgi:hypothetical protein